MYFFVLVRAFTSAVGGGRALESALRVRSALRAPTVGCGRPTGAARAKKRFPKLSVRVRTLNARLFLLSSFLLQAGEP